MNSISQPPLSWYEIAQGSDDLHLASRPAECLAEPGEYYDIGYYNGTLELLVGDPSLDSESPSQIESREIIHAVATAGMKPKQVVSAITELMRLAADDHQAKNHPSRQTVQNPAAA